MGGTPSQSSATAAPQSSGNMNQIAQMISAMMGAQPKQQQPPPTPQQTGNLGQSGGQSPQMQAAMNIMGAGSSQQQPQQAQAQSGGPTFQPDADGNLQIVPSGTLGAGAYMNQQNQPQQNAPAPSQSTMQSMFQNPQFLSAIATALGGIQ
jgi:hypothetical protein